MRNLMFEERYRLPKGPRNSIADLGVQVGHFTYDQGDIQTGVTAILPQAVNSFIHKLPAACHVINGYGKTAGLMQIEELGLLETPIVMTNTLSVGAALEGLVARMIRENPDLLSVNGIVCECNDSGVNDIRAQAVKPGDVDKAFDALTLDFELGAVGAGRAMKCHGFSGGIGTASRQMCFEKTYSVGALVLSNHARTEDLVIHGNYLGEALKAFLDSGWTSPSFGDAPKVSNSGQDLDRGSIIVILATDLPLDATHLKRLAKRAVVGLSRTGSVIGNHSGEVVICFSTREVLIHEDPKDLRSLEFFNPEKLDLAYLAVAEAVEEAVLRSMLEAAPVMGHEGRRLESLAEALEALKNQSQPPRSFQEAFSKGRIE